MTTTNKISLVVRLSDARALVKHLQAASRKSYGRVVKRQAVCVDFDLVPDGTMIHTRRAIDTLTDSNPFA